MHRPISHRGRAALALGLALSLAGEGTHAAETPGVEAPSPQTITAAERTRHDLWLDTATAYAMSGDLLAADSLLVGLLSLNTADATVLNAMGNVRTLQGRPDAARAFYDEARGRNPAAAGIRLNLANSLLELGRDAEAESVATVAIAEVGGLEQARTLMGLRPVAAEDSTARGRAATKPIDRRDLEKLLERAAARVPKSKTDVKVARPTEPTRIVSKAGAPRASGPTESRPALYWGP